MLIQGAPQEKGGRFPVWKAVMAHEQEEKGILEKGPAWETGRLKKTSQCGRGVRQGQRLLRGRRGRSMKKGFKILYVKGHW